MSQSNPILQLKKNPRSRSLAIKAKCAECFGCSEDHLEKGFKDSISSCSSYSCPLHRFRPYQPRKSLERQKNAVQNLSIDSFHHEYI
jgi:hypothetical protein